MKKGNESFFETQQLLDNLCAVKKQNFTSARTMPGSFFYDQGLFELECDVLFKGEWLCLGHQSEIPNIGDYFTFELVKEPLLICRNKQNNIVVLSNVCRHRSNILATHSGNSKKFVCGYHAWAYDLDGKLVTAPYMDKVSEFDPLKCNLHQFKHEIWNGYIFINLNGKAEPLGARMKPLDDYIANYQIDERVVVASNEEVWNNNWKSLIENFMEAYHINHLHPQSLRSITPTQLCKKVVFDDDTSNAKATPYPNFTAYRAYYPDNVEQRNPFPKTLNNVEQRSSLLFSIFPSFISTVGPNCSLYLTLQGNQVEEVKIKWAVLCIPGAENHKDTLNYINTVKAFNSEDKFILENVQKGVHTQYSTPSHFAPYDLEGTIWDFYLYLSHKLT